VKGRLGPRRQEISVFLAASILALGACSGLSLLERPLGNGTSPAVASLSHCGDNMATLCIVSWGLQDDQNIVFVVSVPSGSTSALYLRVQDGETTTKYPCSGSGGSPATVRCPGQQIPLGATVTVEICSTTGNAVLARGTFVINGLELVTAGSGPALMDVVTSTPQHLAGTPAPTRLRRTPTPARRTPSAGTATPTP
jgi:hypothetical protein